MATAVHPGLMALLIGPLLCAGACSKAVEGRDGPADASPVDPRPDAEPLIRIDGGPSVTIVASECPDGQFATGFDPDGKLVCATVEAASKQVVNEHCSLFAGWRDSCNGCLTDPLVWGQVRANTCENGAGALNTCTVATLGAASVNLFGYDLDGDVNDDDKFYMGFRCDAVEDLPVAAGPQCPDGSFIAGVQGSSTECVTALGALSDFAQDTCNIYFGWRDSCDGCTTAPAKVGRARTVGCTNGGGANNTCINTQIAGGLLDLFGLNTDGDVNGDDKFYVGFQCAGAVVENGTADESCPSGQLVTAITEDGTLECQSPKLAAEAAIAQSCYIYHGWRDNCSGCSTAPAKWGRVSSSSCENGLGANNTCNTHDFGGVTVTMFGLNTDGDVNGDDKFYAGIQCE